MKLFKMISVFLVMFSVKADGQSQALSLIRDLAHKKYPHYVSVISQHLPVLPISLKRIQKHLLDGKPEDAQNELNYLLRNYNSILGLEACQTFYDRAKEYGSGGRLGKVKIFPGRIEKFFKNLFNTIVQYGHNQEILLVADDLFHGHVMLLHDKETNFSDIVIVFHAKEFPADLPEAGGFRNRAASPANFNMRNNRAFNKRNFIYSLRSHTLVNLQKDPLGKDYQDYKELVTEYDLSFDIIVNTLREHYFGRNLFDINYFPNLYGLAQDIVDPKACPVLFAY